VAHRLARQELANRGAERGAPIARARVGRTSGAFELKRDALSSWVQQLSQGDGAPVAELMPSVTGRERCHAWKERVATEQLHELRRFDELAAQASRSATSGAWATSRGALTRTGRIEE